MEPQDKIEDDLNSRVSHKLEHNDGHDGQNKDMVHAHKYSLKQAVGILDARIIDLLVNAVKTTPSPWAIILVRFSDQTEPSPPLKKYQELFTSIGNEKLNMVDYFKDMSHGKLDLNSTQVFGWYTLSESLSNYVGNTYPQPQGKLNRNGLLDAAKAAAVANGVDLTPFAGVVVSALGSVDLCGWVGGGAALCDSYSLTPSLLGQEMGHGYGLDHARHNNSDDDYRDPWDVMSTAAYPHMQAPNSDWGTVGPGLNAWNMRSRGWLDESRVWKSTAQSFTQTIQLRPLHHHHRRGWLAIEVDEYLVEFRIKEKWDAAIPRDCILVHRFEDNKSYLMPSVNGNDDINEGDKFESGSSNFIFSPYLLVTVDSIDPRSYTATVTITKRAATKPPHYIDFIEMLGGIPRDGDGVIIIGGKVVKVPPRSPVNEILKQIARYLNVQFYDTGVDRAMAEKQDAALSMIRASAGLLTNLEFVSHHPPGYNPQIKKGNKAK